MYRLISAPRLRRHNILLCLWISYSQQNICGSALTCRERKHLVVILPHHLVSLLQFNISVLHSLG